MKRTEPMSIAQIVDRLMREENLEEGMLQHRALGAWGAVTGPVVNRCTTERRVAGGVLYVRVASAPVRQELSMQRTALIEALNRYVGKDVIKEIRFV